MKKKLKHLICDRDGVEYVVDYDASGQIHSVRINTETNTNPGDVVKEFPDFTKVIAAVLAMVSPSRKRKDSKCSLKGVRSAKKECIVKKI